MINNNKYCNVDAYSLSKLLAEYAFFYFKLHFAQLPQHFRFFNDLTVARVNASATQIITATMIAVCLCFANSVPA